MTVALAYASGYVKSPSLARRASVLSRIGCVALFAFVLISDTLVAADDEPFVLDTVVLKSGAGSGQIAMKGRIIDYTGTTLTFEDFQTKATRTYPSAQVQSVVTPQTDNYQRGARAFSEDRPADA